MTTKNLKYFFEPKSVAIIGASRNTKKIGHVILRNFVQGFNGRIYPVNPNTDTILDLKCYKSLLDVPGTIDLVIISIHAELVPGVMKECAKKEVKAVVIVSGGFAEVGRKDLEDQITRIAESAGIRVIGPNCIGVFDAYTNVDSLFLPSYRLGRPPKGRISLISQSGALGGAMLDWANMHGYGFSKFVSYGNACDVDETDLIDFLGDDKKTALICAYLEGVERDGPTFIKIASKVSSKKPIIAIKGGTTKAGGEAVSSHTASLAGSPKIYEAVFRQCGIIQAYDLEEALDFSRTLIEVPLPKGRRVLTITNGGGLGILSTDAIEKEGLELAELSKETVKSLKSMMPEYVVIRNPIDLTGDADTARYAAAIDAALKDPNVDIILINILFQVPTLTSDIVEIISEKFIRQEKPIIVVCLGGSYTQTHKKALEKYGIPTFDYPERAAKALRCLVERSEDVNYVAPHHQ
ncbi:MAG: CoA-binding protein [Candidatus Altiarchaeota archaeon]|nr:CoA-binding protein [Candidatus Altiarchaeota archaeon]